MNNRTHKIAVVIALILLLIQIALFIRLYLNDMVFPSRLEKSIFTDICAFSIGFGLGYLLINFIRNRKK